MIKITTDSTCDLPAQLLEQHHISVIPLGIVKGGELFRDGENITTADIAAHVDAGGDITTTNAVSIGDYEALFARESARNDAVIHLNIGIGFSCCHQNACLAAEEFDNVHVVDTANLSVGHGLLVLLAADYLRDRLSGRTDIDHRRCILVDTAFSDDLAAIGRKVLAEVGGFDEVIETKAGCTIFCHCGTNTLGVVFLRK